MPTVKIENTILIVDDIPVNIDVMVGILSDDYRLKVALNGEKALQIATSQPAPDLILLDIVMPGMDGYEVCRRLKDNDLTRDIPVIFVSGKSEIEDEEMSFEVGAVDFISKPVSPPIVKARVDTQLKLKTSRDDLLNQNEVLQQHLGLQNLIDRITKHDLRNPLSSIIGYLSIMRLEKDLPEKIDCYLERIDKAAYRILEIVNNSLSLYKIETGQYQLHPEPVNIFNVICQIAREFDSLVSEKRLNLRVERARRELNEQDSLVIEGEELLYYSMLANLVKNALEASQEGEQVSVTLFEGEQPVIKIHNQGAVPEDIRSNFFDKYVTADKIEGTGLGTYSAKLMGKTLGCSLEMQTSEKEGTLLTIYLPAQ